jgi:hypothetical protein
VETGTLAPEDSGGLGYCLGYVGYWLNGSRLVIDRHHRDEGRVLLDRGGDFLRIDAAVALGLYEAQLETEGLEQVSLFIYCGMLDLGRDYVKALDATVAAGVHGLPEHGEKGDGIGLAAAAGEDETPLLAGRSRAQGRLEPAARPFED